MSEFLRSLLKESADHTVEPGAGRFTICRKPGRERQFDNLARRVLNTDYGMVAFSRRHADGLYECVEIVSTDPDA